MTGNLGNIEIMAGEIQTAEIKAITRPLKVAPDIDYPCGAIVVYDTAKQHFRPSGMTAGKCFVVAREKKATDGETALCIVHGTVQRDRLVKADSDTLFTSWKEITDSDYTYLLNNSTIM